MNFPFHLKDARAGGLIACACLFLSVILAGLATNPFFEMGVNDDWAYSQFAFSFAQTGQIAYVGGTTTAALIQTPYGALLTKLFGGSFVTHRLGTLFVSGFIPILVYRLGLLFALEREMAFFGAMTVGLSPLFLPHAVSFMTESYGCVFLLAAIYAGVRAVLETAPFRAAAWFSLAMAISFLGGMNRQVVWVTGPPIAVAYCFSKRKQHWQALWGLAFLIAFFGGCWLVLTWLQQQPGFFYEMVGLQILGSGPAELRAVVGGYAALLLTAAVFAIPALSAGVTLTRSRPAEMLPAVLAAGIVFAASYWTSRLIFPYLPNVVTEYGLFRPGLLLPGGLPVILPATIRRLVTAAAVGLSFALLGNWFSTAREAIRKSRQALASCFRGEDATAAAIFIPVGTVAGYLFALLGRAKTSELFDRYSLPILPLLVIGILGAWQNRGVRSPALAAWAILILFGVHGVAITHDHFEQVRAKLRAKKLLETAKTPRERILAGYEDDMLTQVALDGMVYLGPDLPAQAQAVSLHVWYLKMVPRIAPLYFLATSNLRHMSTCGFEPVHYSTWLPPRDRQIWILCPE